MIYNREKDLENLCKMILKSLIFAVEWDDKLKDELSSNLDLIYDKLHEFRWRYGHLEDWPRPKESKWKLTLK